MRAFKKTAYYPVKFPIKIILVCLLILLFAQADFSYSENGQQALPVVPAENFPEAFLNQDIWYDISFLWFSRAAEAHFYFEKGERPSEYRAVLEAETKGFIGWLTSHRKQKYLSIMELEETSVGRMLRSRYFRQEITDGSEVEKVEFILDYSKRLITTRESKAGKGETVFHDVIPDNIIYNDVLSAYFNLRGGVLGNKKKGETFLIDTMPRKGVSHIRVSIADGKLEKIKSTDMNGAEYLIRVDVDKRIFGQKDGVVWIWADTDLVPVMGEVMDVVFFGDVTGYRKTRNGNNSNVSP